MSNLGGNPVHAPGKENYFVPGRAIGGTASIAKVAGSGWTIARTGTGVYVVTPDVNFPKLEGGVGMVMSATNPLSVKASAYVIAGGAGTVANITFTVFNSTTGTATDLGAAEELWLLLAWKRSTV